MLFSTGLEKGIAVRNALEIEKMILEEDENQAIELFNSGVRRRRGR